MRTSVVEKGVRSFDTVVSDLSSVIDLIRDGGNGLKEKIEKLRITEGDAYKENKLSLMAFTPSCVCEEKRKPGEHTGNICLDYDFDSVEEALEFKSKIMDESFVLSAFISPGGKGVKVIKRLLDIPELNEHKEAYQALESVTSEGYDKGQNDITRLCFFSYDPDIYFDQDVEGFDWRQHLKQI